jgi:hypothetical protein
MPSIFSLIFNFFKLISYLFLALGAAECCQQTISFSLQKKKKQTQSSLTDISDPPNNHSPSRPSKLLFAGRLLRNSIRARPESRILQLSVQSQREHWRSCMVGVFQWSSRPEERVGVSPSPRGVTTNTRRHCVNEDRDAAANCGSGNLDSAGSGRTRQSKERNGRGGEVTEKATEIA